MHCEVPEFTPNQNAVIVTDETVEKTEAVKVSFLSSTICRFDYFPLYAFCLFVQDQIAILCSYICYYTYYYFYCYYYYFYYYNYNYYYSYNY